MADLSRNYWRLLYPWRRNYNSPHLGCLGGRRFKADPTVQSFTYHPDRNCHYYLAFFYPAIRHQIHWQVFRSRYAYLVPDFRYHWNYWPVARLYGFKGAQSLLWN